MKKIIVSLCIAFIFVFVALVLILQKIYPGGYSDLLNLLNISGYNKTLNSFQFVDEEDIKKEAPTAIPVDFSQTTSYTSDSLGITFDYVPNATLEPIATGGEADSSDIYGYSVQHPNLTSMVDIFLDNNPKNMSAKEWYTSKRGDYHPTLIQEIDEININSGSIFIVAQPHTCQTAPMIVVFIARNGKLYTLWQSSVNESRTTLELQTILSNLRFIDNPEEKISIPKELLAYPSSKSIEIDCSK